MPNTRPAAPIELFDRNAGNADWQNPRAETRLAALDKACFMSCEDYTDLLHRPVAGHRPLQGQGQALIQLLGAGQPPRAERGLGAGPQPDVSGRASVVMPLLPGPGSYQIAISPCATLVKIAMSKVPRKITTAQW